MKKILLLCVSVFMVSTLISCSKTIAKTKTAIDESVSAANTTVTEIDKIKKNIPKSLLKTTDYDEIISVGDVSSSYAIDLTAKSLFMSADYVLLVKAMNVEGVRFLDEQYPLPMTFINLEIIDSLKGEIRDSVISVGFTGGAVTLNEYIKHYGLKDVEKKAIEKLSPEERENKLVSIYPIDLVDIQENEEYLVFLAYDKERNCIYQIADGYSVYRTEDRNAFYNPLSEQKVIIDEIKQW